MPVINIHDAKTQLSRLLEQVQAGEGVVIAKAGTSIAHLVPYAPLDNLFSALKADAA